MQFQNFSLKQKKLVVSTDVFGTRNSSDIFLKGTLSAELFLLIESLFLFQTDSERTFEVSVESFNRTFRSNLNQKTFEQFMRDACSLLVKLDTKSKAGFIPMCEEINFLNTGEVIIKLNEGFDFLRKYQVFRNIYQKLDFCYQAQPIRLNEAEVGQQLLLIA